MEQLTGIMTDQCQADSTVTYFLISAVGENIHYQHNSSLGISIFLGNTSHFILIQWHSKLSILDNSSTVSADDPLLRSVQGNQIDIHTLVEKPKASKFQTVQYLFGQKIWPFLHFNL